MGTEARHSAPELRDGPDLVPPGRGRLLLAPAINRCCVWGTPAAGMSRFGGADDHTERCCDNSVRFPGGLGPPLDARSPSQQVRVVVQRY